MALNVRDFVKIGTEKSASFADANVNTFSHATLEGKKKSLVEPGLNDMGASFLIIIQYLTVGLDVTSVNVV